MQEIITIKKEYLELNDEKKKDILNTLSKWIEGEIKKLR